jgi:hypothetical protein
VRAAAVADAVDGVEEAEMKANQFKRILGILALAGAASAASLPAMAGGLKSFATADAAMEALGSAILDDDQAAQRAMLGPAYRDLIPPLGDPVRYQFIEGWARHHRVEADGERRAQIAVGDKGWTLPVPLIRTATGWQFDMKAGEQEMQIRRIGRNELAAVQVLLAYVDAQNEYRQKDRNGDGIPEYARQIRSSPGKQDGLYWSTAPGAEPSPLGGLFAAAEADSRARSGGLFHGYRYRILTAQGPAAAGGARDYLADGRMTGGFAMIAWPGQWGKTGIMSFIVNQDGQVFEADLGPDSARAAARIREYNPDGPWQRSSAR